MSGKAESRIEDILSESQPELLKIFLHELGVEYHREWEKTLDRGMDKESLEYGRIMLGLLQAPHLDESLRRFEVEELQKAYRVVLEFLRAPVASEHQD